MISPPRRRVMRDRLIAALIAVLVLVVGVVLYQRSDIRAATSTTGPSESKPPTPQAIPTKLSPAWSASTDARLGAVASVDGVVVVTDEHGVSARDAVTGAVRWSYQRSNVPLCSVVEWANGSDRRILLAYRKNGFCSQLEAFDSVTGDRDGARTSPNPAEGALVTGGGYAGWMGSDLAEIWRDSLIRTAQYGNQPNPPNPGTQYTGCTLSDMMIANTQFGTIEHCTNQGPNARIVLSFVDPGCTGCNYPKDWNNDVFKGQRRIDKDTGSAAALIVGLTAERVAVLVAAPAPAVVVYDAAGTEVSRTPVDIPAAQIVAAAAAPGPTAAVVDGDLRMSLIGNHLLAVRQQSIETAAPATTLVTSASETAEPSATEEPDPLGLSNTPTGTQTAATTGRTTSTPARQVTVGTLEVAWTAPNALGLPATIDGSVLMPTATGLSVFGSAGGPELLGQAAGRSIPVDRAGYPGRVDATAVGTMIIETRGTQVVGLSS